jgi:hypothetical protein
VLSLSVVAISRSHKPRKTPKTDLFLASAQYESNSADCNGVGVKDEDCR